MNKKVISQKDTRIKFTNNNAVINALSTPIMGGRSINSTFRSFIGTTSLLLNESRKNAKTMSLPIQKAWSWLMQSPEEVQANAKSTWEPSWGQSQISIKNAHIARMIRWCNDNKVKPAQIERS
jgi:hypothetical protein